MLPVKLCYNIDVESGASQSCYQQLNNWLLIICQVKLLCGNIIHTTLAQAQCADIAQFADIAFFLLWFFYHNYSDKSLLLQLLQCCTSWDNSRLLPIPFLCQMTGDDNKETGQGERMVAFLFFFFFFVKQAIFAVVKINESEVKLKILYHKLLNQYIIQFGNLHIVCSVLPSAPVGVLIK